MRTISVLDLRHKWPGAEAALNEVEEIIITRDSQPVAKITWREALENDRGLRAFLQKNAPGGVPGANWFFYPGL